MVNNFIKNILDSILNISSSSITTPTWLNVSSPTQSLIFPYAIQSVSLVTFRIFCFLGYVPCSPKWLVRIIRFYCTAISLLIDCFVFQIARKWHVKPNLTMILYATSYVPWLYFTHNITQLLETLFFTAFLHSTVYLWKSVEGFRECQIHEDFDGKNQGISSARIIWHGALL